ncbi:hypothetical protein CCP4SC76_1030007 [Gammaproteobacteria bacterium]
MSGCQCLWPYYPSGWAISTGGEGVFPSACWVVGSIESIKMEAELTPFVAFRIHPHQPLPTLTSPYEVVGCRCLFLRHPNFFYAPQAPSRLQKILCIHKGLHFTLVPAPRLRDGILPLFSLSTGLFSLF